ncbi:hypothetical protein [Streptomyces sp. NPDC001594]|uniref:hypothetical protein n=1 Tax=Streptomyces sp. NPDC001594 TaxID=3364590 RepID=UPI00368883DD
MTAVVWVGFGDLDAPWVPPQGMEYAAIPPGIKIEIYTPEYVSYGDGWNHWDDWSRMGAAVATLSCEEAAPNHLRLRGGAVLGHRDLHRAFDGAFLMAPGLDLPDPLHLCSGEPGQCPTTAEDIRSGMTHECQGILGHLDRSGFAGTTYLVLTQEVRNTAGHGGAEEDEADGEEPEEDTADTARTVRASETVQSMVAAENSRVMAAYPGAKTLHHVLGGGLFLIDGDPEFENHDPGLAVWALDSGQPVTGELEIERDEDGSVRGIRVEGIGEARDQAFVRESVRRFAACEVSFGARRPSAAPAAAGREWDPVDARKSNHAVLSEFDGRWSGTAPKLHYMFGDGLLLIAPDRGFAVHRRVNRHFVAAARPLTGTLLVGRREVTVVPAMAVSAEQREGIEEQIKDPYGRPVVFAAPGGGRAPADDSFYVDTAHRRVRDASAPPFLVTEPDEAHSHLGTDHAHDVNIDALSSVSAAAGLADLSRDNELHYRIGGGLLLLSRDAGFADHAPVNRQYVSAHSDAEDCGTGALFVYRTGSQGAQGRRIDVAPDSPLSDKGKYLFRAALARLCPYEVTFYA